MTLQPNYSYYSLEKMFRCVVSNKHLSIFLKIKARIYHLKKPFYGLLIFLLIFFLSKSMLAIFLIEKYSFQFIFGRK